MKLIDADGQPRFGIFPEPADEINYWDYDYRSPMGRRIAPVRKYLQFHQFQYYGVISPELLFGCAVADLRTIAAAFVYVYHPPTRRLLEYSFKLPLGIGMSLSSSPTQGTSTLRLGRNSIAFTADRASGEKGLQVTLGSKLSIDATFSETDPPFEPMSICTRAAYSGWVYAQKTAGVAVSGKIRSEVGEFDLAAIGAHGHLDYSAGYMRHETFWNWACLSGALPTGDRVGLNVSCGVNETSYSENCYWLKGKLVRLGLAHFDFDRADVMQPWHVTTDDGRLNLHFEPEGQHVEHLDLGLLASNFKQVFGRFSGRVDDLDIENMYGFCEDQYAKW